jgi:3-methyladenine DNA glycosylase AlkD
MKHDQNNIVINMTTTQAIIAHLQSLSNDDNRAGMARFGIETRRAFGISVSVLRGMAKNIKQACKTDKISSHTLALELWKTGYHEARLLAILIEKSDAMTSEQIEIWVHDLDSWDLCDQLCSNLLWKLPQRSALIYAWCAEEQEFVRRAGFVLITQIAVHDKKASNDALREYFPLLEQYAYDERNFVKKAINWAVRQIGKRNPVLCEDAIALARRIQSQGTKGARWIAADALRELEKYEF